jgi:hypothetical protein
MKLKRGLTLLLLVSFVFLGFAIAFHSHSNGKDSDHCNLCQVFHTPIVAAHSWQHVVLDSETKIVQPVELSGSITQLSSASPERAPPQA